jgi:23S rRNA pseudouridine2457 synthase
MSYRYLLFHKPYDVLSQFSQPTEEPPRQTLKTFIPVPDVYPVGRLDRDSEGLMLLTNHGWLQHRLSDPRYGHARTYWVQVDGVPTLDALDRLRQGIQIQNYRTRPCQVTIQPGEPPLQSRVPPIRYRKNIPTTWLTLTLQEGKNRQVRRMTAAVGYPTLRLVRVAIGPLELGSLPAGEWRYLTEVEQQMLIRLAKAKPQNGGDKPPNPSAKPTKG